MGTDPAQSGGRPGARASRWLLGHKKRTGAKIQTAVDTLGELWTL
jgi:hypothetical protein